MGKKSLTKSTTKKKATKKGGKKKAVSTSAKNTTAKKPTLKTLLKKQFDAWAPETLYQPEPDAAYAQNFTAPPAVEAKGKAAEQIREILSRQFDLSAPEPKKAAPKKTAAKKPEAAKADKKAPKKTAPPAKKTEKKKEAAEAPKKAAPKKAVSVKDLLALKFDAWQPEKQYAPAPDTDYDQNFAAPPAFEAADKSLIFKQFDLSVADAPAGEKPAEQAPAPEAPQAKTPSEPEPAEEVPAKEPVPIEMLLKKQFDTWTPEKLYAPAPDTDYEKNYAAPPAFEGADSALLFRQFDLSVSDAPAEEKPVDQVPAPEEPAVAKPAETEPVEEAASEQPAEELPPEPEPVETAAPEAEKVDDVPKATEEPEEPEPVSAEPTTEEKPAEEAAALPKEEPAAAPEEKAVEEAAAEQELAEPAAVEPPAPESEIMEAAAKAASSDKPAEKSIEKAAEAPTTVEKPKSVKKEAPETPEPEKAAPQPPEPPEPPEPEYPDWSKMYGDGKQPPRPPMPPEEPPLNPALKLLIASLGVLFALIIAASISNMQNYFIKTTDDAVEIWQGDFSPRGTHRVIKLYGAKAPETIKDVYTRNEALPLAFRYYMDKADAMTEVKGDLVDFDAIRQYLKEARTFAVTKAQKKLISQRLSRIDYMMLTFKADVAAEKQTVTAYDKALDYLQRARELDLEPELKNLIDDKISVLRAAKAILKAEEKFMAPPAVETPETAEPEKGETLEPVTGEEAHSAAGEATEPEAGETGITESKTAGDQTGFIKKPGTERAEESKAIAEPEGTSAPSAPEEDHAPAPEQGEKPATDAAPQHH